MITDFGRRLRKRRKSAEFWITIVDGSVSVKDVGGLFFGGILDANKGELFTFTARVSVGLGMRKKPFFWFKTVFKHLKRFFSCFFPN